MIADVMRQIIQETAKATKQHINQTIGVYKAILRGEKASLAEIKVLSGTAVTLVGATLLGLTLYESESAERLVAAGLLVADVLAGIALFNLHRK